ncbi:MAG: hypothetical protein H6Q59_569, partial [Firmicutes bacterium]|nr:hypothetical protein [Bacillota bacterium]
TPSLLECIRTELTIMNMFSIHDTLKELKCDSLKQIEL